MRKQMKRTIYGIAIAAVLLLAVAVARADTVMVWGGGDNGMTITYNLDTGENTIVINNGSTPVVVAVPVGNDD